VLPKPDISCATDRRPALNLTVPAQLFIVSRFGFGRRNVANGLEQTAMVEPVHPLEGGEFHGFSVAPGTAPMDHLGFEQTDDGLGERIVVTVANAADHGLVAGTGPEGPDSVESLT
jgi:hypothetical protein